MKFTPVWSGPRVTVLADGVKCYRKYAIARDLRGRQIVAETLEWVLSREASQLFSFESICKPAADPASSPDFEEFEDQDHSLPYTD